MTSGASPNGYAHVAVQVGRIGVLAYDPDSVRSYVTAWTQALDLAGTLGPGGAAFAAMVRHRFEKSRL